MIWDDALTFSKSQTVASSQGSTNVLDFRAAHYDIGGGRRTGHSLEVLVVLSAVAGTNPTLNVDVQGADDPEFTQNVVTHCSSGVQSGLSAGSSVHVRPGFKLPAARRYLRLYYTIGGTDAPAFTINRAGLLLTSPTNVPRYVS